MTKHLTDYQKEILDVGYIYKLWSDDDDKIYFGSCSDYVKRIQQHNAPNNKCTSKWICGDLSSEILEKHRGITRYDLKKRERWFMENHKDKNYVIINKNIPTQEPNEYHKKRYAKNPSLYAAKQKVYYYANWEKEQARLKKYQEKRKGDTWFCSDCNQLMSWNTRKTHIKTLKHISNASDNCATTALSKCVPSENTSVDTACSS